MNCSMCECLLVSIYPENSYWWVTGGLNVQSASPLVRLHWQRKCPQEQMCPAWGRALCWEASHGAVLVFASAFPPDGGAWASPFAKTLLEVSPCPGLLWHYRPPEFLLLQSLGCWGELWSLGARTVLVCITGRQREVWKTDVVLEKHDLVSFGKDSPSCKS